MHRIQQRFSSTGYLHTFKCKSGVEREVSKFVLFLYFAFWVRITSSTYVALHYAFNLRPSLLFLLAIFRSYRRSVFLTFTTLECPNRIKTDVALNVTYICHSVLTRTRHHHRRER
jgi:hypothetical protein